MGNPFPKFERGLFHLTDSGWVRCDHEPFPGNRRETWRYEMECGAEDAKEQVCLTKIWSRPGIPDEVLAALHRKFGTAVEPDLDRNVTLECQI